jgi:hypothetical protein
MATIVTKRGNMHIKETYDYMQGHLSHNNNRFIEVIELVKIEEDIFSDKPEEMREAKRLININIIDYITE